VTEARPQLLPGDPAPLFRAPSNVNPDFDFGSAAGRTIVLSFLGPADDAATRTRFEAFLGEAGIFTNPDCYFFGVVLGKVQGADKAFTARRSGMDMFWDEGELSRLYGALPAGQGSTGFKPQRFEPQSFEPQSFEPLSFLLGLDMRIMTVVREPDPQLHVAAITEVLKHLPPIGSHRAAAVQAPVLYLPGVFEPTLCHRLIEAYETAGGQESGFMREKDGKTVLVIDHRHKRRSDWTIEDEALRDAVRQRIKRRIVPEIQKAFQFAVTRMERYIVACYDSGVGGYFQPHRDNTTKGTAHRRFAVTINLNSDAYQGGELMFPEFGRTVYKPPVGGAVVFSCSLLHQALPVTTGRRYAFLPFLYDDAAAKIREANNAYLADNVTQYKVGG
jgi:predicted 2-oxoglutarate/Fe(II)-dependent dioxygenase YbiX